LLPLLEVIPLQILAYHLALYNNANPDYPRNLAKCVTVR
jgi:glucosamine--fructose-6-phosphate aminotransferase (isomerizing)